MSELKFNYPNFNDLQKISCETSKMSDVINELCFNCLKVLNQKIQLTL